MTLLRKAYASAPADPIIQTLEVKPTEAVAGGGAIRHSSYCEHKSSRKRKDGG